MDNYNYADLNLNLTVYLTINALVALVARGNMAVAQNVMDLTGRCDGGAKLVLNPQPENLNEPTKLMWMGSTEEPVADCTVDVGSSVLVTVTELLAGTGAVCHDLDDCSIEFGGRVLVLVDDNITAACFSGGFVSSCGSGLGEDGQYGCSDPDVFEGRSFRPVVAIGSDQRGKVRLDLNNTEGALELVVTKFCADVEDDLEVVDDLPDVTGFECQDEDGDGRPCMEGHPEMTIGNNLFCDGVPNCPVVDSSIAEVGSYFTYDESPETCSQPAKFEPLEDNDFDTAFAGWLFGICVAIFVCLLAAAAYGLWRFRKRSTLAVRASVAAFGMVVLTCIVFSVLALTTFSVPNEGRAAAAACLTATGAALFVTVLCLLVCQVWLRRKRGGLDVNTTRMTVFNGYSSPSGEPSGVRPTGRRANSFSAILATADLSQTFVSHRRRSSLPADGGYYSLPVDARPSYYTSLERPEPVYASIIGGNSHATPRHNSAASMSLQVARRGDTAPWPGYNEFGSSPAMAVPTSMVVQTVNPDLTIGSAESESAETQPEYENVTAGRRRMPATLATTSGAHRTNLEIIVVPKALRYTSRSLPTNLESHV